MAPLTGGGCPAHAPPHRGPPCTRLSTGECPTCASLLSHPDAQSLSEEAHAEGGGCSLLLQLCQWIRTPSHLLSSLWPLFFLKPCPLSGQVGSQVPHESEEALPLAWVGSGLILLTACHHAVPACGAQVSLDLMWHLKAMVSMLGAP